MDTFSFWGGDSPRNGGCPEDGDQLKNCDHQMIVIVKRVLIVPEFVGHCLRL